MKTYSTSRLLLLFTPFVFSFAFGLDIYIPIVPQMITVFDTTVSMVQLTLSLFLFVTGAGQLIIGPLSDQWGRKKTFYLSSALFILGGLGSAFSSGIYELIFARIFSAFGACGLLVTAFAVVRDLYEKEESAKMFSFLNGAIGISPTLAPILGGYLAFYFGWQSVFIFLSLLGCYSLISTKFFIKETHPKELRSQLNLAFLKRYGAIFIHPRFLKYALITGLTEAVFFCFFSISPFIIIELLGVETHLFGFYFSTFGLAIAFGGFAGGKIIEKLGIHKTILLGLSFVLSGGLFMAIAHVLFGLTLEGFLLPMALACIGAMFSLGGSAALALEPFGEIAGSASAAFGAMELCLASIIGFLLMSFEVHSALPYAVTIITAGVLSLFLFRFFPEWGLLDAVEE